MNIQPIIDKIRLQGAGHFSHEIAYISGATWTKKFSWEPASDHSSTLSKTYCRVANTFDTWESVHQIGNILHESGHMYYFDLHGTAAYYFKYAQKSGRLEIELFSDAPRVKWYKQVGYFPGHFNEYVNNFINDLAANYLFGSWFDDTKKQIVRNTLRDYLNGLA